MTVHSSPKYRWRVGETEITRVLEFEAALFDPAVIHPEASPEIIERHRNWLTPTFMDPVSGLMIFAFHSTVIKTPRATILVDTCSGNDKERPHKLRYHRKNWPYLTNLATAGFAISRRSFGSSSFSPHSPNTGFPKMLGTRSSINSSRFTLTPT